MALRQQGDYWYGDGPADDPEYPVDMEMIRGWIERGNFVLYWGDEFHLDGTGQVVGT